jgi:hypothetical protein
VNISRAAVLVLVEEEEEDHTAEDHMVEEDILPATTITTAGRMRTAIKVLTTRINRRCHCANSNNTNTLHQRVAWRHLVVVVEVEAVNCTCLPVVVSSDERAPPFAVAAAALLVNATCIRIGRPIPT